MAGPDQPHQKSDKLGFDALGIHSSIRAYQLHRLRERFKIPQDVFLWVPSREKWPTNPPEGCIAVHLDTLEAGIQAARRVEYFIFPDAPQRVEYPFGNFHVVRHGKLLGLPRGCGSSLCSCSSLTANLRLDGTM